MRTIGSIICGTMNPEDLQLAFIAELESIQMDPDHNLDKPENRYLRDVVESVTNNLRDMDVESGEWDELQDAIDTLNQFATGAVYFGAHAGDGADFGWWPTEDEDIPF